MHYFKPWPVRGSSSNSRSSNRYSRQGHSAQYDDKLAACTSAGCTKKNCLWISFRSPASQEQFIRPSRDVGSTQRADFGILRSQTPISWYCPTPHSRLVRLTRTLSTHLIWSPGSNDSKLSTTRPHSFPATTCNINASDKAYAAVQYVASKVQRHLMRQTI